MRLPLSSILGLALVAGATSPPAIPTRWLATLSEPDGTELAIRVDLRVEGGKWELWSRADGVHGMLNWRQRLLGKLFRKLPPHGALISASGEARTVGDTIVLRGIVDSPLLGRRRLSGTLVQGRLSSQLTFLNDSTVVRGSLSATPDSSDVPLRDYSSIAASVRRTIIDLVFDPAILDRPNIKSFLEQFDSDAGRAKDDLDIVAAFASLQPMIGISHFGFIRNPKLAATPLDSILAGDQSVNPADLVHTIFYGDSSLAYIRVDRWDRVSPFIDRAFQRLDSAHTKVLILDLRYNPGGDATSISPAMHLFRESTFVGGFVGRPWFAAHRRPPTPAEMRSFPVMTSETEGKSLLDRVRTVGGTYGQFTPREPYFAGTVYLLIGPRTASASEPLAHLLSTTHRALLVGDRTAGAMLTALPHPVGEGFIVTVPEADYYASDGTRIEGRGVNVDVRTTETEALIEVGRRAVSDAPYGGWVWLAGAYEVLKRYDDAIDALNHALPLASSPRARTTIETKIAAVARLRDAPKK